MKFLGFNRIEEFFEEAHGLEEKLRIIESRNGYILPLSLKGILSLRLGKLEEIKRDLKHIGNSCRAADKGKENKNRLCVSFGEFNTCDSASTAILLYKTGKKEKSLEILNSIDNVMGKRKDGYYSSGVDCTDFKELTYYPKLADQVLMIELLELLGKKEESDLLYSRVSNEKEKFGKIEHSSDILYWDTYEFATVNIYENCLTAQLLMRKGELKEAEKIMKGIEQCLRKDSIVGMYENKFYNRYEKGLCYFYSDNAAIGLLFADLAGIL